MTNEKKPYCELIEHASLTDITLRRARDHAVLAIARHRKPVPAFESLDCVIADEAFEAGLAEGKRVADPVLTRCREFVERFVTGDLAKPYDVYDAPDLRRAAREALDGPPRPIAPGDLVQLKNTPSTKVRGTVREVLGGGIIRVRLDQPDVFLSVAAAEWERVEGEKP